LIPGLVLRPRLGIKPSPVNRRGKTVKNHLGVCIPRPFMGEGPRVRAVQRAVENKATHSKPGSAVSSNHDSVAVLEFLKPIETTPAIAMLKLRAIADLIKSGNTDYKWVDFKTLAMETGSFDKVSTHLDNSDASFSAHWAGSLGVLFFEAKEFEGLLQNEWVV